MGSIDSDKSNSSSYTDMRDSISLFNTDDVNNQKKYEIKQTNNASINSDKSNWLNSAYLVNVISLSNIENEPIINEKYQKEYVTKQERNSSIDSDKLYSTSSVDLVDAISLSNLEDEPIIDGKYQKEYVTKQECNSSIDSDKSNCLDSEYLVDAISPSNIEDEPTIDEKNKKRDRLKSEFKTREEQEHDIRNIARDFDIEMILYPLISLEPKNGSKKCQTTGVLPCYNDISTHECVIKKKLTAYEIVMKSLCCGNSLAMFDIKNI